MALQADPPRVPLRDPDPYIPPSDDEFVERERAIAFCRKKFEEGAGPGSIRFRLVKNGIPKGMAYEIVQRVVNERRRREQMETLVAIAVACLIFGPFIVHLFVVGSSWP